MDVYSLDPLSLPLNKICLIEASAGTGKTYTITNLYLRLLLGVECPKPLSVEQILVVTFTVAATQELKDRIRLKIHEVYELFRQKQAGESLQNLAEDPFLTRLYTAVEGDLESALLRLKIAEQEIDLASIFTIHSFCQKMLLQFAFDSGVRFDIELQTNQNDLIKRLSKEVWRELFYPLNLAETEIVAASLGSPDKALKQVQDFLTKDLPTLNTQQHWIEQDFSLFMQQLILFNQQAKQYWQENREEVTEIIRTELAKVYKSGEKKALNRRSYQERYLKRWLEQVDTWAQSNSCSLPEKEFERFCQEFIEQNSEEGSLPLSHHHFAKNQQILTAYRQQFSHPDLFLLYKFLLALRQKWQHYKQTHKERGFDDILTDLNQSLKTVQGKILAKHIRRQFPFAMIDEFQDTDQEQYEIFSQIFMTKEDEDQGFIMIGDPKQSIYKFRGADIFTYIAAAKQADEAATLDKNWRSVPSLVENTNKLFYFDNAFLYKEIDFRPVTARDDLCEELGVEANYNCYLQNEFNQELAAKQCAYFIQQQLKKAEGGQFYLQKKGEKKPLVAEDFAVLVRTKDQARLMKQALSNCHIQAVILSEDRSVYATDEAHDLLFLLRACLSPYEQKTVIAALASNLWHLTAREIFELKHNESLWEYYVAEFIHYQHIWQQQGVLPMLHHIFLKQKILEKMKSTEEGDRRVTNLLHLTELLQSAMSNLENKTALLHWYETQLQNPTEGQDDQTLRLESEEKLVKIVTIHGSKGLQYPVVWLPFAGKSRNSVNRQPLMIYHDRDNQTKWAFSHQDDEIDMLMAKEEYAEDLRLLYVAITRAEYQLNMILPQQFDNKWNAMLYLLSNGECGFERSESSPLMTKAYLTHKDMQLHLIELEEEIPVDDWRPENKKEVEVTAATFTGRIKQDGRVTSFTALHTQYERNNQAEEMVQDYDYFVPDVFQVNRDEQQEDQIAYQFPHGIKVGKLLHSFFEHCDFTQPIDPQAVQMLCEQAGLNEEWIIPTQQWLERVICTKFGGEPFALNEINPKRRLNELQFYMRLSNEMALPKLSQLLKRYSPLAKQLPDLQLAELEGFVVGVIDCVVLVNNKYYILDYKSNYLGNVTEDYTLAKIEAVMGQYRYDLQYLLYTLALHRYLTQRLGKQYDYERDFGGVAYLFLRGMNGTQNSGVYFDKPSVALITNMDRLFG